MNPILIQLGPLIIYKYGFLLTLAVLAGAYWVWKEAKKEGFDEEKILDLILTTLVGGIIGGRIFYVLFHFHLFKGYYLDIFKFWQPGSAWYGAFIGGFLAAAYYLGRQKWSVFKIGDIAMPALALGQALGSFACLFGACAVPTQLYEAGLFLLPFLVFVIFRRLYAHRHPERSEGSLRDRGGFFGRLSTSSRLSQNDERGVKKPPTGAVFFSFLAYFSLARFGVSFFRWERIFVWRADANQILSVAFFVYAVLGLKRLGLLRVSEVKQLAFGLGNSRRKRMLNGIVKLPKSFLESVKKTLSRQEEELKGRERQLRKRDPYMEPGRDVNNAEVEGEVTENVGHETVQTIMKSVRSMRMEVKKALAKMKIGKYGICEKCGQPIDPARLKAFPAATLCAHCAQDKEQTEPEVSLRGTRRMQ